MCEFCKNIGKLEKIKSGHYRGTYKVNDRNSQIIFHNGQFNLYYYGEDCDEVCVENMRFCPKCGRKLSRMEG